MEKLNETAILPKVNIQFPVRIPMQIFITEMTTVHMEKIIKKLKEGNFLLNCTCKIRTTYKYTDHITQRVFQTVRKRWLYKYVVME